MNITQAPDASFDRRTALRLAGGAALSAGVVGTVVGGAAAPASAQVARITQAAPPVLRRTTAGSELPTGAAFTRHLLLRTTFGLTPALFAEVDAAGGAQAWLERQLDPASLDDSACDAVARRFPLAHASPPELHARLSPGNAAAMLELVRVTAARNIWSKRQLFEVMTEFWSNHLNVTAPSGPVWASRGAYDRDVIRANALGRFDDMLVASALSPAMLHYLDGDINKKQAPNENYGRELLELHTVGIDGGQTSADILDAARAFTGLTTHAPASGVPASMIGLPKYDQRWHYVGPLRVLGWTHDNPDMYAGQAVAESLVRYLARQPSTASRLARKLAIRFVSDNPPAELVDLLAEVYLTNNTEIVPVLRALFASPQFAESAGQKFRRPWEDAVATVRTLDIQPDSGTDVTDFTTLVWFANSMGAAPLGWRPPDGYPDVAQSWIGTGSVLTRWNLHTALASGWFSTGGFAYPGDSLYARLLPGLAPASRAELVTALWNRLMPGTELATAHLDALVAFLGGPGPVRPGDTQFQFAPLVSVLLSSPLWSLR